jgi:hypothetical protein
VTVGKGTYDDLTLISPNSPSRCQRSLQNMQTEDIEQKKHVYLYLIKTLSRFVHSQYIRVEKTIDYLAGPIQWCLCLFIVFASSSGVH